MKNQWIKLAMVFLGVWCGSLNAQGISWQAENGAGMASIDKGSIKLELMKPGDVSAVAPTVAVKAGKVSAISFKYTADGVSTAAPLQLNVKWFDAAGKDIDAVRVQLGFPPVARTWEFTKNAKAATLISDNISVPDQAVSARLQFRVNRPEGESSVKGNILVTIQDFSIQEGEKPTVGLDVVQSGPNDAGALSSEPKEVKFGTNLAPNPALELGQDTPEGWKIEGDNQNGSVEWLKGGAFSGKRAFKLYDRGPYVKSWERKPTDPFVPGGKPTGNYAGAREEVSARWVSNPVPVTPGKAYQASAFYWYANHTYLDRGVINPIRIQFLDEKGQVLPYTTQWDDWYFKGSDIIMQPGWVFEASKPLAAPGKAVSLRIAVAMPHAFYDLDGGAVRKMPDERGFVIVDNISVFQVPDNYNKKDAEETYRLALNAGMVPFVPTSPQHRPNTIKVRSKTDFVAGLLLKEKNGSVKGKLDLEVSNLLGDKRSGNVEYEILNVDDKVIKQGRAKVKLDTYGTSSAPLDLPSSLPAGPYAVNYKIRMDGEGNDEVSGRSPFGITPVKETTPAERAKMDYPFSLWMHTFGNLVGTPQEEILGKLADTAGMGKTWFGVNIYLSQYIDMKDPVQRQEAINKKIEESRITIAAWRKYGVTPMARVECPNLLDPSQYPVLEEVVKSFISALKDDIKVWRYGTESMHGGVEELDKATVDGLNGQGGKNYLYWGRKGTVRQYWQEYIVAYKAAKSADPNCIFGPQCASDINGNVLRLFFKVLGKNDLDSFGMNTYISAFSIWPANVQQLTKNGLPDLPIFVSEFSAQAHASPTAADHVAKEIDASKKMVQYWAAVLYSFPSFFHLEQWGMILGNDDGSLTYLGQVRPQYLAYANMTNLLGAGKFTAKYEPQGAILYVRKRSVRDGHVAVAWAKDADLPIDLEVNSKAVTVYDIWGNSKEVKAEDGVVSLTLTQNPIYVVSKGEIKTAAAIALKVEHATLDAGKPAIRVVVTNQLKIPISGEVEVVANGPLRLAKRKFDVKDLQPQQAQEFVIESQLVGELRDQRLNFIVRFKTDKKVYEAPAALNFNFAKKSTTSIDGNSAKWKTAELGMVADRVEQFHQWNSPKAWGGKEDISVHAGFRWDEKYLYTIFNVTDDAFVPPGGDEKNMWQRDVIELLVDVNRTLTQGGGFTMFGLAKFDKGPKVLRFDGLLPKGEVPGVKIATQQNGNVVTYEAAIPWNEIQRDFVPKVGQVISVAWSVDDHDGGNTGRRCISWFSRADEKNPGKFGDMILCN